MKEFVILMAYLTAMIALAIDAMLPALGIMATDLAVTHANDIQYVIAFIFIGMTIGQLIYGPISDAFGRKPSLFAGIAIFIVGCLISWAAQDLTTMLAGRFLQGLGVAGPRIITLAIVRDKFHGRQMASIMSMIMGTFIMIPAVAPAIGQGIIHLSDWRTIFLFYIANSLVAGTWAYFRLEETLPAEKRRPLNLSTLYSGFKEVISTRTTMGYTLCSGLVFGGLLSYLNSAQQIFHEIFQSGDMFAVYFGGLALAIGGAFFSNAALVGKYGMRPITLYALIAVIIAASLFLSYTLFINPINLTGFLIFAAISFFSLGLTFGNMGAMALEPMGHIAGLASAFMGAISTLISVSVGILIGQLYDGSVIPLVSGFLACSSAGLITMLITEKGIPHAHPDT